MRHAVFGRKLGRDINSRKALLANLANSLFETGYITTSLAKAKLARPHVEKLISQAKKKRLNRDRVLASQLTPKALIRLLTEIAPGFDERPGGFTRIIKLGSRKGDNSPLAKLELLPWAKPKEKKEAVAKKGKKAKRVPVKKAQAKATKTKKVKK